MLPSAEPCSIGQAIGARGRVLSSLQKETEKLGRGRRNVENPRFDMFFAEFLDSLWVTLLGAENVAPILPKHASLFAGVPDNGFVRFPKPTQRKRPSMILPKRK